MATELAKAYVQIIPSARGMEGAISDVMNGESTSAGEGAGKGFASSFGSMAKKALVGLGVGKIIMDAIGDASEFETSMAKVSTLFKGDVNQFGELQNDILNMSSAYGLGATTLAEAAYSAESAGVEMENLGPMLEGSAKLALAGFTDIDTALSATAKTMNAYGDQLKDVNGNIMDMEDVQKVLIQTQNLGITTVGELGSSLANVTPTAAAMGVGFDQVGAAMAQLTASGVQTAQATTQLRSAMTELGKSGTKADKAFREATKGTALAGKSFQEAMASGANLGDVFGLMQSYADKTGQSMVDLWGSVEAGNAAMLIASDVDTFNSNLEQMATDVDVVGEAYGKMADTFGNSMSRLKESAKNFMTTLFSENGDVAGAFDNMLASLGDVGEKLKTWLTNGLKNLGENLPKMMSSLLDFAGSLLDSLAQVDWIELGTTIINGIIGALGTLGQKLITLIGGAISAVANGEVNFGELGTAIWNGVTSVIKTTGEWLKTLFETARDAICGENGVNFSNIGTQILNGVKSILDGAGKFLAELFGFGRDAASGDDMNYKSIGEKILDGVKDVLDAGGKFLGDLFDKGLEAAEDRPWPTIGDAIKTGVNLALNAGAFLGEVFSAGAELIKAINWENVGGHIENLLVSGLDGAAELVTTIASAADRLLTSVGWESIGQGITDLLNAGLNGATMLVNTVSSAADTLLSSIGWESIGQGITNLINAGLNGATALVNTLAQAGQDILSNIKWGNIGQGISGMLEGGLSGAATILKDGFTAAHEFISNIEWGTLATDISTAMSTGLQGAGQLLEDAFTAAHSFMKGIKWEEVGAAIQAGLGDVWSGLTGFFSGVLTGAGEAAEGIGSGIGAAAEGAGKALAKLFTGDDAKAAAEGLKQAITDMETALTDGKTKLEKAAKNVGACIRNSIEGELTTETMNLIGSTLIGDIDAGVTEKEGDLDTHMENVGKSAAGQFSRISWSGVGSNIVSGIISGVDHAASGLYYALRTLATNALAAARQALGIKSPSTVMRDMVGKWIPAGIAEGIEENSDFVSDAMNDIAEDAAATDIRSTLAAQNRSLSGVASVSANGADDGLISRVVAAVREGMENANIALYMDKQKVGGQMNEYLGSDLAARRFA